MIKVSGGARSLRGVRSHLDYIGREGHGAIETDDGMRIQEKGFEKALVEDWDLDLDVLGRGPDRQHSAAVQGIAKTGRMSATMKTAQRENGARSGTSPSLVWMTG
jgi:hypothetical protein